MLTRRRTSPAVITVCHYAHPDPGSARRRPRAAGLRRHTLVVLWEPGDALGAGDIHSAIVQLVGDMEARACLALDRELRRSLVGHAAGHLEAWFGVHAGERGTGPMTIDFVAYGGAPAAPCAHTSLLTEVVLDRAGGTRAATRSRSAAVQVLEVITARRAVGRVRIHTPRQRAVRCNTVDGSAQ